MSARQPLREVVYLGSLVNLDGAAVDVDDVEAAVDQFSRYLRAWHDMLSNNKGLFV